GIKQAYVPAASSPQLAYKVPFHSPSDCLRARVRSIAYGPHTPFPQVGIKQAYVPAASSPQLAYKVPFHSPVLTAFGHECDRLPTVP
ncbi:hypothetical protein PRIPAC_83106, partial [Pristionchus pacificus]|uniref:Uncharacterized protein n=1 Tax=Pristionchus pacificus TaxID=54126 RepID=A0A2A6BLP2_PRIPA